MLKGIHPLLGPDLLHAIRTMGHGDDIVIADANFPSSFLGPKVIRADGVDAVSITEAILAHMPLDTFVPEAAWRMEVVGDPDAVEEMGTASYMAGIGFSNVGLGLVHEAVARAVQDGLVRLRQVEATALRQHQGFVGVGGDLPVEFLHGCHTCSFN